MADFGQGDEDALLRCVAAQGAKGVQRLAVAVSGGSDSLALLHLAHQAAGQLGWDLQAVTVDHGLRDEAAQEAAQVGAICAGLGVPHQVLRWDHGEISGNLQDQARRARYALMTDWARAQGIARVWIGHTADDQAETFLMGLSRAAGLDGLSGMRPDWVEAGVRFERPLLGVSRANLRAYLTRRGVVWLEDPSNQNDRFARVRARRALTMLQPLGITVE
ncbi:MAG: tRNA lysidine(34) synthetase TilS, partial [Cypionkella sp.]